MSSISQLETIDQSLDRSRPLLGGLPSYSAHNSPNVVNSHSGPFASSVTQMNRTAIPFALANREKLQQRESVHPSESPIASEIHNNSEELSHKLPIEDSAPSINSSINGDLAAREIASKNNVLKPLPIGMISLMPLPINPQSISQLGIQVPQMHKNAQSHSIFPELPLSLRNLIPMDKDSLGSPVSAAIASLNACAHANAEGKKSPQSDNFDDSLSIATTATVKSDQTYPSSIASTVAANGSMEISSAGLSTGSSTASSTTPSQYSSVDLDFEVINEAPQKRLPVNNYVSVKSDYSPQTLWQVKNVVVPQNELTSNKAIYGTGYAPGLSETQAAFCLNLSGTQQSGHAHSSQSIDKEEGSAKGKMETGPQIDNSAREELSHHTFRNESSFANLNDASFALQPPYYHNASLARSFTSSIIAVPIKRGRGRPKRAMASDATLPQLISKSNASTLGVSLGPSSASAGTLVATANAGDSDAEESALDESILNGTSLALALPDASTGSMDGPMVDILDDHLPWDNDDEMIKLIDPTILPPIPTGVSLMIDTATQTIVAAPRRRGRPSRAVIEEQQYLLQKLILDHFRTQRRRYLCSLKERSENMETSQSVVRDSVETDIATIIANTSRPFAALPIRYNNHINSSQCPATGVDIAATGATSSSHLSTSMGIQTHYEPFPFFSSGHSNYHHNQHACPYTGRILDDDGTPSEAEEDGSHATNDVDADGSDEEFNSNFNLGLSHELHNLQASSINRPKIQAPLATVSNLLESNQQQPRLDRPASMGTHSGFGSSSSQTSRPDTSNDEVYFFDDSSDSSRGSPLSHASSPRVDSQASSLTSESGSKQSSGTTVERRTFLRATSQRIASKQQHHGNHVHIGSPSKSLQTMEPQHENYSEHYVNYSSTSDTHSGSYKPQYLVPTFINEEHSSDEDEEEEIGGHFGYLQHEDGECPSMRAKRSRKSGSSSRFTARMSKKDRNKLSAMKYRQKRKLFMEQLETKAGMMEHVLLCLLEEADGMAYQLKELGATPVTSSLGSISRRILRIARDSGHDILQQLHLVDKDGYSTAPGLPQLFVADASCHALQDAEKQFIVNQVKSQSQGSHVPTGPMSVLAAHVVPRATSHTSSTGTTPLASSSTKKLSGTEATPLNVQAQSMSRHNSTSTASTLLPSPLSFGVPTNHDNELGLHSNSLGSLPHIAELEPDPSYHVDHQSANLGVKRARLSVASQGILMFALFSFFFMLSPFTHTSQGFSLANEGWGRFLPTDITAAFSNSSAKQQLKFSSFGSIWSSAVSIARSLNPYPALPHASTSDNVLASYIELYENQTKRNSELARSNNQASSKAAAPLPRSRVLLAHEQVQTLDPADNVQLNEQLYHRKYQQQQQNQQAQQPQNQQHNQHPAKAAHAQHDQQHIVSPQALFSILLKSAQYPGGAVALPHMNENVGMNGGAASSSQNQQMPLPTVSVLDLMSLLWHVLMPILFYFMLTRCGILETINVSLYGTQPKLNEHAVSAALSSSASSSSSISSTAPNSVATSALVRSPVNAAGSSTTTSLLTDENVVAALASNEVLATHSKANAVAAVADAAAHAMLLRHQQEQQQRKQALAEQMIALQRDERLLQQQAQYLYQRQQHLQQYKIYQQQLQQQQLHEQEQLRRHDHEQQLTSSGQTK